MLAAYSMTLAALSTAIPTISSPDAALAPRTSMSIGISSRQGAHQVAQKFTTTTLPRHSAMRRALPSRSVSSACSSGEPAGGLAPSQSPAAPAPTATAAKTSALRRSGAIALDQSADLGNAGAPAHLAGLAGLERHALVARVEHREPQRRIAPEQRQHGDGVHPVPRVAAALGSLVGDIALEQEQLHLLGILGIELQLDLGVGTGRAGEHRSGEVGPEARELLHRRERELAQLDEALRVLIGLVQRAVLVQRALDLFVARQRLGAGGAQAARGLSLGEREIVDAVLGHDAGGGGGDAGAHAVGAVLLAAHRESPFCWRGDHSAALA